ncbi:hypothetical protein BH10PSE2_BH10PSE2_28490 [soil metagenome]
MIEPANGMMDNRSATESRWLRRLAMAAMIIVPILLGFTGFELVREFQSTRQIRADIDRSYETRLQVQRVFSLLQDAETGVRGFVLTGDDRYLGPYSQAARNLRPQQDRMDVLLDDQGSAADRALLRTLAARKMAILADAIGRIKSGLTTSQVISASSQGPEGGRAVMDQIRVVIGRLVDREADRLDQRSTQAEERSRRTERLVAGVFVALLAVIAASVIVTWRYILARRALVDDLRAAWSRTRVIFDSALDAIITLNPSGSIETVNSSAERMFGYSQASLARRDISLLIDIAPDGDGEFLKRLGTSQGALTKGLIRQMEGRRNDGDLFPVDVALSAMTLATGTHVVAVVRDISERRRIEIFKDEFVSTVSHELRTPLTSIAGSLGLLAGGAAGVLPDKAARLIQIANANSQRLVRLIDDILDIEKVESGKLRLDLRSIDLRVVAAQAIESVKAFADLYGVQLSLAEGASALVRGDEHRLVQVVTNLLSNACKFSPSGGQVRITVDRETRVARLSVTDDGPGIPETFRAQIFSKFAQADASDARAKGGTGLGLAIAREIAERHGGRLWFESTPGEGTTFHLDLPLEDPALLADMDVDGPRLLIVEDDPDAGAVLRAMLEADGFVADIVGTAQDALAAAKTGLYAAALVDLNLPDSDGVSLIRSLRQHRATHDLPVVVVSADIAAGRGRARALEVLDWLEKPFDQSRLRTAVAAIHRRKGDGRPVVLHVDDDPDILEVTAAALSSYADVVAVESLADARLALAQRRPDLLILDLGLPDGSGLELLGDLGDDPARPIPVIVYSAQEMDGAVAETVDAVLTKSRTSLASLARSVRRLTDGTATRGSP